MEPKPSKWKEVTSSCHGSKRSMRVNEDVSLPQQPLRCFGLHWVTKQEVSTYCRVDPEFEEFLNDDDATDEEVTRVDSDIESDDDKDDSKMGEAALAPTDDED
ncbi:hypothetical protein HAX54_036250 [Datura stramonium]|uniref:Uncharacterized protein n=1 Tax=Datura stramonium TaxID=4076 RepID=A0ABS8SFX8_DATST|nr:hypothetical protein [Datura stramonium]